MTTQAEDLGKLLGAAITDAADKHGTAIVAASIHIHTGLSQIAEALGGRNTRQTRQDALGRPSMPGARGTATEPERGTQDATQPPEAQRPGWADALILRIELIKHSRLVLAHGENRFTDDHGHNWTTTDLARLTTPPTVILDANGNPPAEPAPTPITVVVNNAPDAPTKEPQWADVLATAANPAAVRELINRLETAEHRVQQLTEPEWLDADQLDNLRTYSIVLPENAEMPRWKHPNGDWYYLGSDATGHPSWAIAPAIVLWDSETDR